MRKSKIKIEIDADLITPGELDGVRFAHVMRDFASQFLAPTLETFGKLDGPLSVSVVLETHVRVPSSDDHSSLNRAIVSSFAQSAADYFQAVRDGVKDCDCHSCRAVRRGMEIMGADAVDVFIEWLRDGADPSAQPTSAEPLMEILRSRQRQMAEDRDTESLINLN